MQDNILFTVAVMVLALGVLLLAFIVLGLKRKLSVNDNTSLLEQNKKSLEDITGRLNTLSGELLSLSKAIPDEFSRSRQENSNSLKDNREELSKSFSLFKSELMKTFKDFEAMQKERLSEINDTLTVKLNNIQSSNSTSFEKIRETTENKLNMLQKTNIDSLESLRNTLETRLASIQASNDNKLDEMRKTVDDKLSETISKRFSESFNLISERLEKVQQGLGEMTTLASDVGGLKKVLTNVKTRGNIGEIQLGTILEQMLSRDQYIEQYSVKSNLERVDFAIKLPGNRDDDKPLFLPVDAKFPTEDFQRLQEAYETGIDIDNVSKCFEDAIKKEAKSISDKYINPPDTTDFAIMFVPAEGIYAEILRRTGLFENLQRTYKVTVVGPSNLTAFLSSLQMGFRTLAIEKRSSEVWNLLGAVKTEFGKFGTVMENAVKNLDAARSKFDDMGRRSRSIERKLRTVETLPEAQSSMLLDSADFADSDEPYTLANNM